MNETTYALKTTENLCMLSVNLMEPPIVPPNGTFFDLVTLTYELDLDVLPLGIHTKKQVGISLRIARRTRQMQRQTE